MLAVVIQHSELHPTARLLLDVLELEPLFRFHGCIKPRPQPATDRITERQGVSTGTIELHDGGLLFVDQIYSSRRHGA